MKATRVNTSLEISLLKTIIWQKCSDIGRPELEKLSFGEIKNPHYLSKSKTICRCRIRGMTYTINLTKAHYKMGTFDPVLITKDGTRVRRGYSCVESN